jgi:integrase
VFTSFAGKGTRPTARRLHRSAAWRIVHGYARAVGLEHVTPHDFRRFVITETAKRYGIRVAQRVARHKRIETTAGYVLDELAGGLTEGLY